MHILWHLQLSSTNKDGKILLDTDSNWSFARNIIKGLLRTTKDVKVTILIPELDQMDWDTFQSATQSLFTTDDIQQGNNNMVRIMLMHCHYDANPITARFSFDFENMSHTVQSTEKYMGSKIDFIWINDPALVMNWKVLLHTIYGTTQKPKIISYNHWIDNRMYPKTDGYFNYTLRQIEGVLHSDLHLVNSNYASEMLLESFNEYGMESQYPYHKVFPIPNVIDFDKLAKYTWNPSNSLLKRNEDDPFIIVYNHRISSFGYYKNAFDDFIWVCDKLYERAHIKVILTNPSGKDLTIRRPYMELQTALPYDEYLELLSKSHLVASAFREGNGGMWSSALMEGLAIGVPTMVPKHSGYVEMVPNSYEGFFTNKVDLLNTIHSCMVLPNVAEKMALRGKGYVVAKLNPDIVCKQLYKLMEGIK